MNQDPSKQLIIDRIVAQIDRLPPVPANIVEMRHILADPNATFAQLTPIIRKDPGLSADILKFANSARYGITHRVDTIEEALLYFGMGNLIEYVAVAFAERAVRGSFSALQGLDKYFGHSREISRLCQVLGRTASISQHDQEALELIGLLHDIGKLVLAVATQAELMALIGISPERMKDVVAEQIQVYGIDHCTVGQMICTKWHFPDTFGEAIVAHHVRQTPEHFSAEGALLLLAHVISIPGVIPPMIESSIPPGLLLRLNLNVDKILSAAAAAQRPAEAPTG